MQNIFLSGLMAVLLNLLYEHRIIDVQKYCNAVLEMSSMFYGIKIHSPPDFKHLAIQIETKTKNLAKISENAYSIYFDTGMNDIREYLNTKTNIKWPMYDYIITEQYQGWNNVDSPLIWEWIHVITLYIDTKAGIIEKIFFIEFIKFIIGCSVCQQHYISNIKPMIKGLNKLSLTDTFLLLHSVTHAKQPYNIKHLDYIKTDKRDHFNKIYISILKEKFNL